MRSRVGTSVEVLFERPGKMPGQIVGRSPWLVPVHVDAPESMIGTVGRVTLTGTTTNGLFGTIAAPPAETLRPALEIAS